MKYIYSIYKESIVDVEGLVSAAPETITGCSQQDVELAVTKVCQIKNELSVRK